MPQSTALAMKARSKPGRRFLFAGAVFVAGAYLFGLAGNPFLFILYVQLAFLFFVVYSIFSSRHDPIALVLISLFVLAFVLGMTRLAPFLGALFLTVHIGRSAIGNPRWKSALTPAAAAVFLIPYLLLPSPPSSAPALPADRAGIAKIFESLPYIGDVSQDRNGIRDGVVVNNPALVSPGLNLYNSYYKPAAYLLDMEGRKIHEWKPQGSLPNWHFVTLCDNGDLLVCIEDSRLMRLDWDSHIVWQTSLRAHHDIDVAADGNIVTLISRERVVFAAGLPIPIIDDAIVVLNAAGMVKKDISMYELLRGEIRLANVLKIWGEMLNPADFLWRIVRQQWKRRFLFRRETPFDIFHSNTVTLVDRSVPGLCRAGDTVICSNALGFIGICDMEGKRMRWTWGSGQLEGPHNPTLLDDGNILVFDNGTRRKFSRLVEIDPRRNRIVWEYRARPETSFYTNWGGSAQRLPNGNSLVTETSAGRVFEITPDGRIVWEYFNPDRGEEGRRATIYRMTRITDARLEALLLKNRKDQGE